MSPAEAPRTRPLKNVFVLLALVSAALVTGGCNSGGAARSSASPTAAAAAASAAAVPSRGCYDHKGRIERTVTTEGECRVLDWVWKA